MLKAIFWKEWRVQSPFLFTILIVMPLLAGVLRWTAGTIVGERYSLQDIAATVAACIALIQAIVTGSLLFAAEVEGGTLDFLDACSAERDRIWRAKMLSGLAIALPALVLPALVDGVRGLALTGVAIEILLITAAVSVFVRSTIRAIGGALLLVGFMGLVAELPRTYFVLGIVLIAAAVFVFFRTPFRAIGAAVLVVCVMGVILSRLLFASALAALGLNILFVGIMVLASRRRFCGLDRARHGDEVRTLLVRLPPSWMAGSLWLLVRRHRLSLLVVGLFLGVFIGWVRLFDEGYKALATAPAVLFAVGCALGWNVFALEQAGAERFLGDQRFPRGRLWLAKVGVWLALTLVAICAVAYACNSNRRAFYEEMLRSAFGHELLLGLLGFSAGQFLGIHARQLPVAIFLTLAAAAPIGAAWYAPLWGGEPAWHFAVVSILLLAASRFELRGWTTGRLDGAAHWIRCGLVVLACFAWTGLVLWQRTAEVPDVGEPFVMAESPTETLLERQRNHRIPVLTQETQRRFDRLRSDRTPYVGAPWRLDLSRWHEPGIDMSAADRTEDFSSVFDQMFALGAPDERRDEFARSFASAFEDDRWTSLRKELAELVDGPRRIPAVGNSKMGGFVGPLETAARIFCVKSMLLLAEGKTDAALDDYAMSLALVRHQFLFGGSYYSNIGAFNGVRIETEMLDAAETMLRRGGNDPAFCRGLLTLLDRHAQEMPSFSDLIKASYSASNPPTEWWIQERNQVAWPIAFLFDAPLESIRDDRLQRAFCRGLLIAAERKTLFLSPSSTDGERKDRLWPVRYLVLATPDRSAEDWARILSHQTYNQQVPLFWLFEWRFGEFASLVARRDAIRLACAAALFRHDHGRDLESLADLAPEYFPTLPTSPYAECEFVYRRSPGETWKLVHHDEETSILRTIAPGTGVIEMTGLPKLKVAVPRIR